jgi:hypothetical protein
MDAKTQAVAVERKYVWIDSPFFEVFCAGIKFGMDHANRDWTADEWYAAARKAVPQQYQR